MNDDSKNHSTYGAIFAMILIVVIVVGIAYNTVRKIIDDRKRTQEEHAQKNIVVEGLPENDQISPNDVILYENLTDKEAAAIIDRILSSGEKNQEKLEELETEILEKE